MSQEWGAPALDIAGFWRRVGAFVIDGVILGLGGMLAGAVMFDTFARMGAYGRLLGFFIALVYFGLFNSKLGNGQTPGKRMLGLRVVDASGQCLSLPRSLARYAVLGLPFFFNGWPLGIDQALSALGLLLSVVVFGMGLSIIYLYVFNRRTRQSLHDLVVRSYVVRVAPATEATPLLPVWKGHAVVVGLLLVLALVAPLLVQRLIHAGSFSDVMSVYRVVSSQPYVSNATVAKGSSWVNGNVTHYLGASVRLNSSRVEDRGLAEQTARLMAKNFPGVDTENAVVVDLVYGYDLGFASGWKKHSYSFKPRGLLQGPDGT